MMIIRKLQMSQLVVGCMKNILKNPKKDTCSQSDSLNIQIVKNRCTNEQKAELIIKRSKHHQEAEDAYESKRKD